MTLGFLEHLASLPYAFFQQRAEGDLMMRVNSNAQIREMLTSSTLSGLLDGALASVYLVLLLLASPAMGPLLVLWFGGLQVLNGSLSLGTMLALNALASGFLSPISTLISTALQLQLLR